MNHPGEPKVSTTTPDALTSHRNDPSLKKMESQQVHADAVHPEEDHHSRYIMLHTCA